jgi:hypothetical protein
VFFTIQIFKLHPESPREFSNTYIVEADDFAVATVAAEIIRDAEKDIYDNSTLLTRARISTTAEDGSMFNTFPINENGNSAPSGTGIPLFNTLRMDIDTVGFGRPTKMHYRILSEGVIVGSTIDSTFATAKEAVVNQLIADLATNASPWVQADGNALVLAAAYPKVTQRSLHRRRRKPVTP